MRRRIEATDRQIDQRVYHLYGLTDAEIRLVEPATATAGARPAAEVEPGEPATATLPL